MTPAELAAILGAAKPGDGSVIRLIETERAVMPMLIELWDATEAMRPSYEQTIGSFAIDGLPCPEMRRIVAALSRLRDFGGTEKGGPEG